MTFIDSLVNWTNEKFGSYGPWGLFLLAFMESSFFPVPPDLLLITLSLAAPENAFLFATVATIGSVIGGMFGYLIGYIGEEAILKRLFSQKKIEKVHNLFNKYESWAIFIAGLTPIPYKLFTIAGGVFYVNLKKFVIASVFSRGLRFFTEAALLFFYGEQIITFLNKYFNILTVIFVVLLLLGFVIYRKRKKKIKAS